jgi:hypothetical protein
LGEGGERERERREEERPLDDDDEEDEEDDEVDEDEVRVAGEAGRALEVTNDMRKVFAGLARLAPVLVAVLRCDST